MPCLHSWPDRRRIRQRLHGVDDRQAELDREIVITLVAVGHGHDGTGAVVHEHVIRGEQRGSLAPVIGLMAYRPVNRPVFSPASSTRSLAVLASAAKR